VSLPRISALGAFVRKNSSRSVAEDDGEAFSLKGDQDEAPKSTLLSPWRRRKSVIRSHSGSSTSTTQGGTTQGALGSNSPRSFTRKPLAIDKAFVQTAIVLVPETLDDFPEDELEVFKESLEHEVWYVFTKKSLICLNKIHLPAFLIRFVQV